MSDRNRDVWGAWGAVVKKLLPGDHIHDVAPPSPTAGLGRIEALEAAQLKRMRKQQKARAK